MTTLIVRKTGRFDPNGGDARDLLPARLRPRARTRAVVVAETRREMATDLRQFLTAFAGGFVFLSVFLF